MTPTKSTHVKHIPLTSFFVLIAIVVLSLLAPSVSSGAPEERDIKFIVQRGHSRSIELDRGSKFVELSLTIPKHALSFALSDNIEVEDHIEGAPIVSYDGTAELRVVLEQEQELDASSANQAPFSSSSTSFASAGNWSELAELLHFNFSDAGISKFASLSVSGASGYEKGLKRRLSFQTSSDVPVIVSAEVVTMSGYGKAQGGLGLVVLSWMVCPTSARFAPAA